MRLDRSTVRPGWRVRVAAFASDNKLFVAGASIFCLVVAGAILAPWIAPYLPTRIAMADTLMAPSFEHLMGTDKFGRDIFSRVLYGAHTSLAVGISVIVIAILVGLPIGLLAGYHGGIVDTILMRISDVFLAFPPLLLPIAITAAMGPGLVNTVIALAISWFPWYARIMRGAVMRVRKELYIDAARTMGVSHLRIMARHVTPNALTPVIVQGSMDFGYAILAAASLSFVGLGARPPAVEWGLMAAEARTQFLDHWWTALCPGLAIFTTVLAVNLVGDGLRDILDPKHGQRE
jgi:peptide/nickel transport system permease protein